jgi:hypothetical protein
MQPLSETKLTRPWHWGIAIVGAPGAKLPEELDNDQLITVGNAALVIRVRHAQDMDAERFEGDWDWATATFHIRALVAAEPVMRSVVSDVILATADERISVGDADGEVVLPAPSSQTRVIVSTDDLAPAGLENVWIDLAPAVAEN